MSHSLLFDDTIELNDPDGRMSDGPFWFETSGDGNSFGEPVPLEVAINSMIRDGALTQTESDGNAESTFQVIAKSSDPLGLAAGIAALHRATKKRTTLVWTDPESPEVPTVLDVETSSLHHPSDFDDLAYVRNEMALRLRIVRLPYTRSATLTTETAEGVPSIGATVNAGESTTGWSAPVARAEGVTVTPQPTMVAEDSTSFIEGAGSLKVTAWDVEAGLVAGYAGGDKRVTNTRAILTQAITTTAGTYFSFAIRMENTLGRTGLVDSYGNTFQDYGVLDSFAITSAERGRQEFKKFRNVLSDRLLSEAIVQALPGGFTRYTFLLPDALTISALEWNSKQLVPYTAVATDAYRPHIWVDQVAKAESATLGKQVLKTIEVGGSARTTGAIHVAAPSDVTALGQVVAFTCPASSVPTGFRPDLRQWTTSGTTTADATASNGSYFDAISSTYGSTNSPVLSAPASMFAGAAHTVMARIKPGAGSVNFGVETALVMGGAVMGTPDEAYMAWESTTTDWQFVNVGTIYLPPMAVGQPSTGASVRFRFKGNDSNLDDLYVFPVTGDLTVIDCGLGTVGPNASSHLWIDSPSADQPQGGYWRGATPTRIDSLSAWSVTTVPGTHTFEAGGNLAFAAATGAAPSVSFDYHKRWMFNAAEE